MNKSEVIFLSNEIERIKTLLEKNGYKLTQQRRAALEVILRNEGKHLSTEEIYLAIKKDIPDIGLATVYRTMLILEEIDILHKHTFDDGKYRYEINHADEDHRHHHLTCRGCSKVIEVEEDLLDDLEDKIEKKYKFKILDHNLTFIGFCDECLDRQEK